MIPAHHDIFTVIVDATDNDHVSRPQTSTVVVSARDSVDAELTACQMVAARGRTPVASRIDWDNF